MRALTLAVLLLAGLACGDTLPGTISVLNSPPRIESVETSSSSFTAPYNRTVYVRVNVSDPNGAYGVNGSGSVKVKVVRWNSNSEQPFDGFGESYVNAVLESSGELSATYTYSHVMGVQDPSRVGLDSGHPAYASPPRYYRVKAEVLDGEYAVASNLTWGNADYTYYGLPRVVINEFRPGNDSFIELYNSESYGVDVTGWRLGAAGGVSAAAAFNLSGVIPAGGFKSFSSSESGITLDPGGDEVELVYTDYKVDNFTYEDGDTIGGTVYDSTLHQSIGRDVDGGDAWSVQSPTPGGTNRPPAGQRVQSVRTPLTVEVNYTCVGEPVSVTVSARDQPVRDVHVDVYYGGSILFSSRTDRLGRVAFTPYRVGVHRIQAFRGGFEEGSVVVDVPPCPVANVSTVKTLVVRLNRTTTTTLPVVVDESTGDVELSHLLNPRERLPRIGFGSGPGSAFGGHATAALAVLGLAVLLTAYLKRSRFTSS